MKEDKLTLELLEMQKSQSKRKDRIIAFLIFLLFLINIVWLIAWNLPAEETSTQTEYSVDQDSEGSGVNNNIIGDNNGTPKN